MSIYTCTGCPVLLNFVFFFNAIVILRRCNKYIYYFVLITNNNFYIPLLHSIFSFCKHNCVENCENHVKNRSRNKYFTRQGRHNVNRGGRSSVFWLSRTIPSRVWHRKLMEVYCNDVMSRQHITKLVRLFREDRSDTHHPPKCSKQSL